MVEHTQTIRRQQSTNCLSVLTILWGWRLKGQMCVSIEYNTFQTVKHI